MMTTYESIPRMASHMLQHDPYVVRSEFRQGIEALIEKGDLTGVGRLHFQECIRSMHTGRVREFVEAWMTEDVAYTSEGLPFGMNVDGREEYLRNYNEVITGHYGSPDAHMVFRLDGLARLSEKDLRLDMTVTTKGKRDMVERIRMDFTYNDMFQLCRAMVTTPDHVSPTLSICGAAIKPVCSKPIKKLKPTRKPVPSRVIEPSTIVQAPSFDRPCLHNLWDSVRTKKGIALLRCRTCVSQWKLVASDIMKCRRFLSEQGCPLGTLCDNLHIHARKKTFEDRVVKDTESP
eukprot:TRINITY_DN1777_c0_g4_i1.p1 TRINITY_DN1777_c0_g4~~TRINITY_DN1777_c0_g4_i1.p1  ORF type:complete len:290 (+),score=51.74 TRINITY_DN1777_c0_g4_i1:61-930(+)